MMMNKLIYMLALSALPFLATAQNSADEKPVENWQNLDLGTDGVFGISTEKAYNELLKGKTSAPVVVAVIDGGIDEDHEDLRDVMWVNKGEIPGNGVDDDKNGYVDDVHGWNFIGSKDGKNVHHDNLEMVRLIVKLQPKYASALNSTPFSPEEQKEFQLYKRLITDYMTELQNSQMALQNMTMIKKYLTAILEKMGTQNPSAEELAAYKPANDVESEVIKLVRNETRKRSFKELMEELDAGVKHYDAKIKYHLNLEFDPRKDSVGDNYADSYERFYGNNDITGPDAEHGTHVAGIIAAVRDNGRGIKGVSNNARIMAIRTVPDGDERDKDVANSIRYAVDNGARIINMSFGKSYSWDKKVVDEAVKYALSKDVLLVHAAGNDAKNTEKNDNFPNRVFTDSAGVTTGTASNWIEVGASSWKNSEDLLATFSNYGKRTVDVFAPGVKINSTMPGSTYKENDGTSMASPVVSGLAALVWSYYPTLTASQVKNVIMDSVTKSDQKVKIKVDGTTSKVSLSDISVAGGVVNAYKALQLASKLSETAASR